MVEALKSDLSSTTAPIGTGDSLRRVKVGGGDV